MTRGLPVLALYPLLSRQVNGVLFFNARYTKGVPFVKKWYNYKRVRGGPRGEASSLSRTFLPVTLCHQKSGHPLSTKAEV